MIRVRNRTFATIAVAMIAGAGCQGAPKTATPPPAVAAWTPPATRDQSTAQLEPFADQLDQQIAQLPGTDGTAHRKRVVDILDTLSKALQLANGPDESPAFANRLGVVKASHDAIADQTIPRARMEAAENQSLVASVDALDEVSTKYLFDDDKLPDLVKAAHEKVASALQTQGPMHDLDASAGFVAIGALVREETDALVERFGSFDARTRLATRLGTPLPVAPTPPAPPMTPPPATAPAMPTTTPATTEPAASATAPTTVPA